MLSGGVGVEVRVVSIARLKYLIRYLMRYLNRYVKLNNIKKEVKKCLNNQKFKLKT